MAEFDPNSVNIEELTDADPQRQMDLLNDLCTALCIGIEDYIRNFDIHRFCPRLISVLKPSTSGSVDVTTLSSRSLALILDIVPKSCAVVVKNGAVPKLVQILNDDIFPESLAEEVLKALDKISIEEPKVLLDEKSFISHLLGCLQHLQNERLKGVAINIIANLCRKSTPQTFSNIQKAIPALIERMELATETELEKICLCLAYLLDRQGITKIQEFATPKLLQKLVHRLGDSTKTQNHIVKVLAMLCNAQPAIASTLIASDLFKVVKNMLSPSLLLSQSTREFSIKSLSSSDKLVHAVFYLLNTLLPVIPASLSTTLPLVEMPSMPVHNWFWEDDFHNFNRYDPVSCLKLEQSYQKKEKQVVMHVASQNYRMDLVQMKQYNQSSNVMRNISRNPIPKGYKRDLTEIHQKANQAPTHSKKKKPVAASVPPAPSVVPPAPPVEEDSKKKKSGGFFSNLFNSSKRQKLDDGSKGLFPSISENEEVSVLPSTPSTPVTPPESTTPPATPTSAPTIPSSLSPSDMDMFFGTLLEYLLTYISSPYLPTRQDVVEILNKLLYYSPQDIIKKHVKPSEFANAMVRLISIPEIDGVVASNAVHMIDKLMQLGEYYTNIFVREGLIQKMKERGAENIPKVKDIIQAFFNVHSNLFSISETLTDDEKALFDWCKENKNEGSWKKLNDILCKPISTFQFIKSQITDVILNLLKEQVHVIAFSKFMKKDAWINLIHMLYQSISCTEKFEVVGRAPTPLLPGFQKSINLKEFAKTIPVTFVKDSGIKDDHGLSSKTNITVDPLISVRSLELYVQKHAQITSPVQLYINQQPIESRDTLYASIVQANKPSDYYGAFQAVSIEFGLKKDDKLDPHSFTVTLEPNTFKEYNTAISKLSIDSYFKLAKYLYDLNKTCFLFNKSILPNQYLVEPSLFVHTLLTNKLMHQLKSTAALVLAAGKSLPIWTDTLIYSCSFLFPYEARKFYVQLTTFADKIIHREYSAGGTASDTKLLRNKVDRIKIQDRNQILSEALTCLSNVGHTKSSLEFEYLNEAGFGQGPTQEFYTITCAALQQTKLGLWQHEGTKDDEHVIASKGLFPNLNHLQDENLYKLVGQIIAKAWQDNRLLNIPFSSSLIKLIFLNRKRLTGKEYEEEVNDSVGQSMNYLEKLKQEMLHAKTQEEKNKVHVTIDAMALAFEYNGKELKPNGTQIEVTSENYLEYCKLLEDYIFESSFQFALQHIKSGIHSIIPLERISCFTVEELKEIIGGTSNMWSSKEEVLANIVCGPGYSSDMPQIQYLIDVMLEMTIKQQQMFVEFATGSQRLPVGGLANLNPKLTVVKRMPGEKKDKQEHIDQMMPSSNTCFKILKLPAYSTKQILQKKLLYACTHGRGNFAMS